MIFYWTKRDWPHRHGKATQDQQACLAIDRDETRVAARMLKEVRVHSQGSSPSQPNAETFAQLWQRRVQETPDSTFLVFRQSDGATQGWTYGEFNDVVSDCARLIRGYRVSHGDAIHLALRNSPAFVAIWLAASSIGAWVVPVDPASSVGDLRRQMNRTTPRLGFCSAERMPAYEEAAAHHGLLAVALQESIEDVNQLRSLATSFDAVPDCSKTPTPSDRLAVMFTSGTTSDPKGVVLTQANYHNVATSMVEIAPLRREHRWFVTLPMFHANGQYYCFAPAIAAGASVALSSRFSASAWTSEARDLEVTHASLFAAPIRMILAKTPAGTLPLTLQHVWFAQSLGRQHCEDFTALVGVAPRQLYGMTETLAIVTADDSVPRRHDVIGRPVLDRPVRLVDSQMLDVADETPGMIVVGGHRGLTLFEKYLDDDATTTRSFQSDESYDWFLTGDLAVRDPDGVMKFVGRVDDVIKVAGENVSLSEVEAILAQAPGVLEAAVVARPDAIRDQVPVAYVVPRDRNAPPLVDELSAWAREHLTSAAQPRQWHLIDELPRTSVGKVRRFAVSEDQS